MWRQSIHTHIYTLSQLLFNWHIFPCSQALFQAPLSSDGSRDEGISSPIRIQAGCCKRRLNLCLSSVYKFLTSLRTLFAWFFFSESASVCCYCHANKLLLLLLLLLLYLIVVSFAYVSLHVSLRPVWMWSLFALFVGPMFCLFIILVWLSVFSIQ